MKARCRNGFVVRIPCNWNVNGRCGDDSKPCRLLFGVIDNVRVKA